MVVSSVTPRMPLAMEVQRCGSSARLRPRRARTNCELLGLGGRRIGNGSRLLELDALVDEQGGVPTVVEDQVRPALARPQQCLLGAPPVLLERLTLPGEHGNALGVVDGPVGTTATAAAAWSWVEKMLQLAQRTRAPSAVSVSISTAVCTVMCSDPVMRAPARGWLAAYSERMAMRPGISCSARTISLRPNSAADEVGHLERQCGVIGGHGISFLVGYLVRGRAGLVRAIRRKRNARAPTSVGGRLPNLKDTSWRLGSGCTRREGR